MSLRSRAFNPSRLRLARQRRGTTKASLASHAGISTRSLTAYESGAQHPNPQTLVKLAQALDFPVEFFQGIELPEVPVDAASFRALSKLTATKRDQAIASSAFALGLNDWIEERFSLPPCRVPRIPDADPETAADAVRREWELGELPLSNVIHVLEAHGVRVFSLVEECADVDAFSFWRDGVPFVFLNTMKTAERSRMDAAHELGHLVLHAAHGVAPRGRHAELEAQAFGAAFLMPRGSVLAHAPRTGLLHDLHTAKRYWKVAAANLAHRMHDLGLLSDWQYRMVFVELSSSGQRRTEVGGVARETSLVLRKVFGALRKEEGVSMADVAAELGMPLRELNRVVFGLVLTQIQGTHEDDDAPAPRSASPSLRVI